MPNETTNGIPEETALSRDRVVGLLLQFGAVALFIGLGYYLFRTTQQNFEERHIESGFRFLWQEAGFPIGDSLIDYEPSDTYGQAFLVGMINTFYVSIMSIVLATIVGLVMGVARVSSNWLIAKLSQVYVETLRNIPLLLTLFFVYGVVLVGLPGVRDALEPFPGAYLSQRGLYLPRPIAEAGFGWVQAAFVAGVIAAFGIWYWAKFHRDRTGRAVPAGWLGLASIIGLPLIVFAAMGEPLNWEVPELRGFNFAGGWVFRPEFMALLVGLVFYRGAFIAENVRSGIQAVGQGQIEAARAVGLKSGAVMRLVVLPQALRTIIPTTTNDYASLVKDSSLAVAIGYPEMVSIGGTMIGQNGQAIEVIAMWMAIYLTINLLVSLFMNWANARAELVER